MIKKVLFTHFWMFLNIFDHANACASMCCWSKYTTRNNWNREFYSLANILTPAQMALYQPGCLLQKFLAVKAPGDLDTLAMSHVSYKERTNTTMVTKGWSSKIGLSRFPTMYMTPCCSSKEKFIKKNQWHSRKISMLPLSQYSINSPSSASTNVVVESWVF